MYRFLSFFRWGDSRRSCPYPPQSTRTVERRESKEISPTTYLHTLRHFNRDVRVLLTIAALIGFTVFGGIYTVLLNLYLLRLDYDSTFIGKVNATGLLAFATAALPAGALGSRWGMRRTMIGGLFLAAAGYGLLPAAELVRAPGETAGSWRPTCSPCSALSSTWSTPLPS